MLYIQDWHEGMRVAGIYLCKSRNRAVTKNGKAYENLVLMDKTGMVDAKIWEPDDPGIDEFAALDYIDIIGDITRYNGTLQVSLKRARKVGDGEYDPADYVPTTDMNVEKMYQALLDFAGRVENPYLSALLNRFFVEDEDFIWRFKNSSAAKTIHHAFVGGLLQHTLYVTNLCYFLTKYYPVLNRENEYGLHI